MKIKLTLVRRGGPEVDLVVTADASASIADVASAIQTRDPYVPAVQSTLAAPTLVLRDGSHASARLPPETEVGEAPLGSGATVMIADSGSQSPDAATASQLVGAVTVLTGPDASARFDLRAGSHVIGRDSSAGIRITDPLISKQHARLDVSRGAARIVDLNSANGVLIEGEPVTRLELVSGQELQLGDSVLRIDLTPVAGEVVSVPSRPVAHNRSPRVEARYGGSEFIGPALPNEQENQPFPWLAMVAPVIVGGAMFAVTRSPLSLLFVALSPILLLSNFLSNKANRRRKFRLESAKFATQLENLDAALSGEVASERLVRLGEHPSTKDVVTDAMRLGPLLWTRRPEHWTFLSVRFGIATRPSRNSVKISGEDSALPDFLTRLIEIRERYRLITDVPVAENLHDAGALGIAGSRERAAGAARAIIAQLAALHSPSELVVAAIVGGSWIQEFEWLKWLPHTSSAHSPLEVGHLVSSSTGGASLLAAIEELISVRTRNRELAPRGAAGVESSALEAGAAVGSAPDAVAAPPAPSPAIVMLITEDAPVDKARLVQIAERAADAGIYPVWVAPSVADLPAVSRTYLHVGEDGRASAGYVRLGSVVSDIEVESLSRDDAMALARRLAPVSDAGAYVIDESDLPRSVSMVSLLGPDLTSRPDAAIERWTQNESIHDRSSATPTRPKRPGRLRAIVGQSVLDAMHLDLRSQGPHALVGGTTGSGKSEFLQAWVLGMAAEYSPDRVTFLFVDYKGGSAFAECVNLPHCVGIVTDLSQHLVRRALTSLRAELHHRERLLARKSAKDLLELERRGDPESPPALVIVIDEFAALVGDVPEFVDGVVDIAQRGRSLGIHLIMATQRPAGVIRDNLRANTNLRIALRMADEADSTDVVGEPVAAAFDPALPGRAIAKTGPGRLTGFQSGYAGGWTTDEIQAPNVDIAEFRFGLDVPWEKAAHEIVSVSDKGPTDQARLVATLVSAATKAKLPAPRKPWLEMLPRVFDLTKLSQRTDAMLLLGVSDFPERQAQEPVAFEPDTDGSIAIYGTGGSGKSATLRTLATAAGITPRGGPVDVYGIDFATGSLAMLEVLPHVGSVVKGDDPERIIRLLRMLRTELESRAPRYAAEHAGSITDYRRLAGKPDERRILLLIDGFPAFRQEFESSSARAPWYGVVQQLITEGRQLGIHVAITADRPGSVPSSISSSIQRRVILRLAEDSAYSLLDAPGDILSAASPPGRAILDGFETQIALVGTGTSVVEQSDAIKGIAEASIRAGRAPATEVGVMPTAIALRSLPSAVAGLPVLGLSEDSLQPVGFDPSGTLLVAGPPSSGRSTAVRSLVESLLRVDPKASIYYFGNARSLLPSTLKWAGLATTVDDAVALAKDVTALVSDAKHRSKIAIVIEGISDFLSTPADGALVELIKSVKRSNHLLIAEAESANWGSSWPLLSEVKNGRRGLLLQPENLEGETLLKISLPRGTRGEFPPGRGYFVERGKFARVQIPLTGDLPSAVETSGEVSPSTE